jgi:hypothetical protein
MGRAGVRNNMSTEQKIRKLKKKLDIAWSKAVRKKYPRCIVCGKSPTQAHHAIIRKARNLTTRWMVENGVGLCFPCHKFKLHGSQGDKVFLDQYIACVNAAIPEELQVEIICLGGIPVDYGVHKLEKKLAELTKMIKPLAP